MTPQNKKYSGNNSAEALKAFGSRLENLLTERKANTESLADIKTEINSAGFPYRTVKKVISAKLTADDGRAKALQDLREESGDLPLFLDILAPEEKPQADDPEEIPAFLDRRPKVEAA